MRVPTVAPSIADGGVFGVVAPRLGIGIAAPIADGDPEAIMTTHRIDTQIPRLLRRQGIHHMCGAGIALVVVTCSLCDENHRYRA